MNHETEFYIHKIKQVHVALEIISAGGSLKFCRIAEGTTGHYPRFALTMEWDTAAGQVIVKGAGGCVLSHSDRSPLEYNIQNLINPWFVVESPHRVY